jgi:hypothetical protein
MKYQNSKNIKVLSGLLLGVVLSSPVMAEEDTVETRRAHFISLYDIDGDGKLNDRELHAARKAQADSNEGGRLNRDEREDIRDRREDRVDRREDVRDHREDVADKREDVRDGKIQRPQRDDRIARTR